MRTYPVFNDAGIRSPIFQADPIYVGARALAKLLTSIEGAARVRRRRLFVTPRDIHVEFEYLGRPFIVWEPFGDNSRLWIGPADMVAGMEPVPAFDRPTDICKLEEAFKRYRPPLHRKLLGDVLTLRFIHRQHR